MAALNLPEIPAPLKNIQHYLKTAAEHEQRDPVVCYWARLYGLQTGLKLSTKTAEETGFLLKLMDWLEVTKKTLHDNEAITNEVAAQAHLENYALKLFLYADKNDRESNFGKNVVKAFYTAGIIYDLLSTFGELSEEAAQNRKYAKWKAAYIHNCLKNGETPVPGPSGEEGDDDSNVDPGPAGNVPSTSGFADELEISEIELTNPDSNPAEEPEATEPEATEPDSEPAKEPEVTEPEATEPDSEPAEEPQATEPELTKPDSEPAEEPEATEPEPTEPDSEPAEEPEATEPEPTEPDLEPAEEPEATEPEPTEPDLEPAEEPEATEPEPTEPDSEPAEEPEATEPEPTEPESEPAEEPAITEPEPHDPDSEPAEETDTTEPERTELDSEPADQAKDEPQSEPGDESHASEPVGEPEPEPGTEPAGFTQPTPPPSNDAFGFPSVPNTSNVNFPTPPVKPAQGNSPYPNPNPSPQNPPPLPSSLPASQPSPFNPANYNTQPVTDGGVVLDMDQIAKAQKYLKWVKSALDYDDVPTAVLNTQKVLHLLTTGQDPA